MQRGLLLDVVIRQRATVFELLAGKDQTLLIRRDALLVLDLGLDVVDRVRRLDFEGDGLASEGCRECRVSARSALARTLVVVLQSCTHS